MIRRVISRPIAAIRALDRSLAVLAAIALIAQTGIGIMLPLLPLYALQLGAAPAELALLTSVFALTNAAGQLVVGFLAQRIAPRRMIPAGSAFYAAANALIATAGSTLALVAFRGIAGIGGGVMLIAERLYLARVTPADRLAFSNGILSAAGSLGSVFGPVLGGGLAAADLRIPFIVVAVTSMVAAVAATRLPVEPTEARAPATPATPATAAAPAPAAETPTPSRPLWLVLLPLLLVNAGQSATYGAWITTYGPLVTTRYGWTPSDVAFVWAGIGLGTILLGPWLGRQADRRGPRLFAGIGISMVLGWALLILVAPPKELVYLTSPLVGGGLAVSGAAFFALLSTATDGGRRGKAFGIVTALSNLGIVVGATVASTLWTSIDILAGTASTAGFLGLSLVALLFVRGGSARPVPARAH